MEQYENQQKELLHLSRELALLELFIAKIEVMLRESSSDDVFKAHCLFRLRELKLISIECLKGLNDLSKVANENQKGI